MAKVGRAARVASRQRVESISAAKTIQTAETGELYLVDPGSGSYVITLPALQDGAYFKFILKAVVAGGQTLTIQTAPNTVDFKGFLIRQDVADHTASTNQDVDAAASGDDKIVFGAAAGIGSYVEVYCDGSNWYANGISHLGTLRFAAT